MSQRDAASDDGQQSGFGIRASKRTCVPPGDGGGKGKHGLCSGEEQLGVGATVGYVVQGSVAALASLEQWWHRYKRKSSQAEERLA